ncbi:uncharacterized protein (DUF427 family) [Halopolyspora algeriensis]|uniref:Uncharacterized protein (DUF427 family) n=1 Tax=Halopolyspora algeriensis TaxID=1500506 RepID=A0A368W034_9ACTN|nr:DUF427 domain-containing protein [Halopolyspora algeriensis]RCW46982.1 uncharacterized protein (DUF427 family) [Halopolyspora algeriensis]TQM48071.1 uncharacterized protein (DUF427 family) [Halopolyspora algeriensis]
MALTLGGGPLATRPPGTANYRIDGPAHRLLRHDFPRRVRALFGGEVVVDSDSATLLHESNLLPQLYVPFTDVRTDLLESTTHHTHCPFKGDASYCSVRVGDRLAENAVWSYPAPTAEASWLSGYAAVYWASMDAWFDEDEEVFGHIRDPYHRVDIRSTSRLVQVLADDLVVAESRRAKVLSETGLPNRYYVPAEDVRPELLGPSATHTVCPYKGTASYRSLYRSPGDADGGVIGDAAWSYPDPLDGAGAIAGYLCFVAEGVETRVDGVRVS